MTSHWKLSWILPEERYWWVSTALGGVGILVVPFSGLVHWIISVIFISWWWSVQNIIFGLACAQRLTLPLPLFSLQISMTWGCIMVNIPDLSFGLFCWQQTLVSIHHYSQIKSEPQWLPFSCICCAANSNKNTGRCRTTKDVRNDYRKWELWGMYYPGMMPTADKRLYCTALREAFNSFALKCFRNIWHWIVWPTVDKSVKPFGFVTRQHVSTHFWFLYPSLFLCLPLSISFSPPSSWFYSQVSVYLMAHNLQFMWMLPLYSATIYSINSVTSPQNKTHVYFYAYSTRISDL